VTEDSFNSKNSLAQQTKTCQAIALCSPEVHKQVHEEVQQRPE